MLHRAFVGGDQARQFAFLLAPDHLRIGVRSLALPACVERGRNPCKHIHRLWGRGAAHLTSMGVAGDPSSRGFFWRYTSADRVRVRGENGRRTRRGAQQVHHALLMGLR